MKKTSYFIAILFLAIGMVLAVAGCKGGSKEEGIMPSSSTKPVEQPKVESKPQSATEGKPEKKAVLGTPTDLIVTEAKSDLITIKWKDNARDEVGYYVERQRGDGSWQLIEDLPPDTTSYADSKVECGKSYSYHVKAHSISNESDYSNLVTAKTPKCE